MTYWQRGSSGAAKSGLSLSIILGTLLVPISAVAAIWLSDPGQPAEAETAPPSTTTTVAAVKTDTSASFANVGASEADLRAACGYVGMTLVDAERSGDITDVQQAALDALRDICDEQGLSLPPAPTPDAPVQTVIVPDDSSTATASGSVTSPTTPSVADDDGAEHHDDSEYEHEDEHEGGEVDG